MSGNEPPAALLTPRQREFLRPGGDQELSDRGRRAAWSRIRNRVFTGLSLDGLLLLQGVSPEERAKIFDAWREKEYMNEDWEWLTRPDERAHDTFRTNLTALLAFLYTGVEEAEFVKFDFEDLLRDAVTTAAHARGEVLDEFRYMAETSESFDTEVLLERFHAGEDLAHIEIHHLTSEGVIDGDDLEEYYARPSGSGGLDGWPGPIDKHSNMHDTGDEE